MTTSELKKIVRTTIIAQGGRIYGFNINNIINTYGVNGTRIQNAINYFRYSPQQEKFRARFDFH